MTENWTEPTAENVRITCKTFDEWADNPDPALSILFTQFPNNTDFGHVLLKVVALNATYSTLIRGFSTMKPSFYDVARHMVSLDIDRYLDAGDVGLVERIANVETKDGRKARNYSFATKYCNWHRPQMFPIYDSRVDEYLWQLKHKTSFTSFHRQDLYYNYPALKRVITEFREHFGLKDFNYKLIDKFLYVAGGQLRQVKMGESLPGEPANEASSV